jgi:hypothetical protein
VCGSERSFRGKRVVIVYQMGKVGSSSIFHALRHALGKGYLVYHTHFLNPENIAFWQRQAFVAFGGVARTPISVLASIMEARFLGRMLKARVLNRANCRVISLVREPVSRNVSAFFQQHASWERNFHHRMRHAPANASVSAELRQHFLHGYEHHDLPLTWFDTEMKEVLGVDVLASSFPHAAGYRTYEKGAARLLILRMEDLDRVAPRAMKEFLGLEGLATRHEYSATEKWYAGIYRGFVESRPLPLDYIDRMLASRYARCFYTQAELEALRKRWSRDAVLPEPHSVLPTSAAR